MMTVVLEEHKSENYCIILAIENRYNRNYYSVKVHPLINGYGGYPIREMGYSMDEKKKAYATYRRYKKKYI